MFHTPRTLRVTTVLIAGGAMACIAPGVLADSDPPATIELTGTVRDFHERTHDNGHPDFERKPSKGFGLYSGNIALQLGEDRKPVFTGNGYKINEPWKDSAGRTIAPHVADAVADDGDVAGEAGVSDTGGIQDAASFNQWYRDVPGVNMSMPLAITLVRQEDGTYVFDDRDDSLYDDMGGFFPIDDQLLGNPGNGDDHNFHFTFELHTKFTYDADAGMVFEFTGDDDVWVFINDQLVIDLGGVHGKSDQVIELDRLGLDDGGTYTLDFFFAERHRTQSNFRISTTLELATASVPTMTAAFD